MDLIGQAEAHTNQFRMKCLFRTISLLNQLREDSFEPEWSTIAWDSATQGWSTTFGKVASAKPIEEPAEDYVGEPVREPVDECEVCETITSEDEPEEGDETFLDQSANQPEGEA